MALREIPIVNAFTFIEPGPVVLVTTNDGGKNNVMTISWHMVLDFDGRFAMSTGPWNHSFTAMMKTKECVIVLPPADMSETVVRIGMCSGTDVDKFETFHLEALRAKRVKAPLLAGALACLECRVVDYVEKHGIVILQCVNLWMDKGIKGRSTFHAVGDGTFVADGERFSHRRIMKGKIPDGV